MLNLQMSWQEAAVSAGCLLAAGAVTAVAGGRPAAPRRAVVTRFASEAGLLLGLYALWQYAGTFSAVSPAGAVSRATWIWHAERAAGLPSEAAVQRVFLPHPLLVQVLNLYYDVLHFPVLIGCLIWLFARHRDRYGHVRTTVVVFTAACLLVQLVPVAPPRLLPGDGMTDTALAYGQSVYGQHLIVDPDQLSAMPSVHVGWALLVALAVVAASRSRWRWLALAYPALTTLAVVVTANHFWLDGIAAGVLLALALTAQRGVRAGHHALATRWPPAGRLTGPDHAPAGDRAGVPSEGVLPPA